MWEETRVHREDLCDALEKKVCRVIDEWTVSNNILCLQGVLCVMGTSRRPTGSSRSSAPGTTTTLTSELGSQGPLYRSVMKYVLQV